MIRRKDNNGKVLKDGESQRKDGRYQYRWTNKLGKRSIIYATSLKELREKELKSKKNLFWCNVYFKNHSVPISKKTSRRNKTHY